MSSVMTGDEHRSEVEAEPWEVEAIHAELPTHSYQEVSDAVSECKRDGRRSATELIHCVRRKFT